MPAFEMSWHSFWIVVYTAIGVAVFWGKWGRTRLRPYVLADLLALLGLKGPVRSAVEFSVFLVLGCLVGIGIVEPKTPAQALAAGFGWTGAFSRAERENP